MPIYEMIETIILCFLSNGCTAGTFGSVSRSDDGTFTVQTEGRTFIARTTRHGWAVRNGDFIGEDVDLIEAARLALTS